LDSACCIDFYKDLGRRVSALHISYGQLAEEQERDAAVRVAGHYNVPLKTGKWRGAETKSAGEVPGRNGFLILAALMEAPKDSSVIALGIHAGTDYPDCSNVFVEATERLLDVYSPPIRVLGIPFLEWRKADIFAYAESRDVPIGLTYSCEIGGSAPCGSCVSCIDMLELRAHAS